VPIFPPSPRNVLIARGFIDVIPGGAGATAAPGCDIAATCFPIIDRGSGFAWNPTNVKINYGDTVEWRWGFNVSADSNLVIRFFTTVNSTSEEYDQRGFSSSAHRSVSG